MLKQRGNGHFFIGMRKFMNSDKIKTVFLPKLLQNFKGRRAEFLLFSNLLLPYGKENRRPCTQGAHRFIQSWKHSSSVKRFSLMNLKNHVPNETQHISLKQVFFSESFLLYKLYSYNLLLFFSTVRQRSLFITRSPMWPRSSWCSRADTRVEEWFY